MTDYQHDLLFGSFLTPSADNPDRVLDLALLSEQLGLDLVTFQDHPYQAGFLDTSTLLNFVAARTTTIRLAANVTNLPLRPPAVLARSVASLDRLSGGRIELGLGTGAFWDAIEAMGGRRLAPGDAVQALDEAITVIRELWDADARGVVHVDGAFHRVIGAKRGPAPAHDVGIWLGAYKPRMLALTGRRADGWLPSLGYLQPGALDAGNAAIDEAAEQAGRSPRDIRRLLNINGQFAASSIGRLHGPTSAWVRDLTQFALESGISAFILASDSPDDLRRFAHEVAPAVREAVHLERSPIDVPGEASAAAAPDVGAAASAVRLSPPADGSAFAVVPTPDDGNRRSATAVWDESTRPTGPAPDSRRIYSAHEQANGRHLVDVHDMLRTELAEVDDLVKRVAAGSADVAAVRSHINTMTMRQNNWTLGTYCETYCRIVTLHHGLEDQQLFPGLRRGDPRLNLVLDRLQQEHVTIHDVLETLDRALVDLVSNPDGMRGLRAAVDQLSDSLLSHLAYEERELVEPLARLGLG